MGYIVDLPSKFSKADSLEDILCLSVLIASKTLLPTADISDSKDYYKNNVDSDCGKCPFSNDCLACIINE